MSSIKRVVYGVAVKLLHHVSHVRQMMLIEHKTRCVRAGEIHELVTTTHLGFQPGARIDDVGFVGFLEFTVGGVVETGDEVFLRDRRIGQVCGFDECHFPNHYNILISVGRLETADSLELAVEDVITFTAGREET
jgi:hypothetical protein